MAEDTGAGGFRAPAESDHVAAGFAPVAADDQMPDIGAGRRRRDATPPELTKEIAAALRASWWWCPIADISRRSSGRRP